MKNFIIGLIFCCTVISIWGNPVIVDDTFEFLGEWIPVNGKWAIDGGSLVQKDESDKITHITRKVKQSGVLLYEVDITCLGGLEDDYGGFGFHLLVDKPTGSRSWGHNRSYLFWLTYDPEAYGKPLFFAQLYKSTGPVDMALYLMKSGDQYPMEEKGLTPSEFAKGAVTIHLKLQIDLNSGKGRLYHPGAPDSFYPLDLGIKDKGRMFVSLRTNSLAARFDNFRITRLGE